MELPWEDGLLERKTEGYEDEAFLKTMVAFANSVSPKHTAIILIGERDNGKIVGVIDPDKFQMRLHKIAKQIYPAIVWRSKVYEKDSKYCVRVEIEYSGETPHFGGIAWVRKGSETVKATDEVFQSLIDLRSQKVRELAKWIEKKISIDGDESMILTNRMIKNSKNSTLLISPRWDYKQTVNLLFVNSFWITVKDEYETEHSEPIEKIILSFDNEEKRLLILVKS